MAKPTRVEARKAPAALSQHNQTGSRRTVQLTRQAIAALQAQGDSITLMALAEATRAVDESGKGVTPKSILHNPEARELFHQHSSAYQDRQRRLKQVKRKRGRPRIDADTRANYRGLRTRDLTHLIEELKREIAELKNRQTELEAERAEAARVRDEALEENVRQLAALTALKRQLPAPSQG